MCRYSPGLSFSDVDMQDLSKKRDKLTFLIKQGTNETNYLFFRSFQRPLANKMKKQQFLQRGINKNCRGCYEVTLLWCTSAIFFPSIFQGQHLESHTDSRLMSMLIPMHLNSLLFYTEAPAGNSNQLKGQTATWGSDLFRLSSCDLQILRMVSALPHPPTPPRLLGMGRLSGDNVLTSVMFQQEGMLRC